MDTQVILACLCVTLYLDSWLGSHLLANTAHTFGKNTYSLPFYGKYLYKLPSGEFLKRKAFERYHWGSVPSLCFYKTNACNSLSKNNTVLKSMTPIQWYWKYFPQNTVCHICGGDGTSAVNSD